MYWINNIKVWDIYKRVLRQEWNLYLRSHIQLASLCLSCEAIPASSENNRCEVEEYKGTGCAFNYFHTAVQGEMYGRKKDRESCKIIATNPVQAWCSGVAHVDRERRLPKIAEMHVEAGGQSDLVGKRSRCDSTDSVENLGTFARTRTNVRARDARTRTRV